MDFDIVWLSLLVLSLGILIVGILLFIVVV
jgi:hypothetical protein